ncbi:MAG: molybdopterin-dependent oxidoreductase [Coprothermobacterota bacterium]|nr:molybdopterin-dependent oxidoreductase [Coprothermobacterota bacterium]
MKRVVLGFLLAALFGGLFAGCVTSPEQQPLQAVEVRDYQGQRLDSVTSFRENSISGPQKVDLATYRLEVKGLVTKTLSLPYDQVLSQFPSFKKVVALHCVEGWDATVLWEGPRLKDIFQQAGVKPEANTVIFTAVDGYTTSLPLEFVVNRDLLLANKMNQIQLSADRGFPFELVAEEKWGYKWIRWVKAIELSANADYQGYWEIRGYSDSGDLDQSYFR